MRIQHNITAMNSYRNFSANNSRLGKNLEKLSSGYAINRAGDDAAGLAISEKMRAQITGIEGATKNSKDGISLIQTAEGALTEVHDMLNRMTTLAEQSANGTYQNELDREQLQKEVEALKSEIDRIADSTNFNGLKLLDGSLAESANSTTVGYDVALTVGGKPSTDGKSSTMAITTGTPTAQVSAATIGAGLGGVSKGKKFTIELTMQSGESYKFDLETGGTSGTDVMYNGTSVATIAASNAFTAEELANTLDKLMNKDESFMEQYTISSTHTGGLFQITSVDKQFDSDSIKSISIRDTSDPDTKNYAGNVTISGKGEYSAVNFGSMAIYDSTSSTKSATHSILEVDGKKFAFAKDDASAKELGSDVNVVFVATGTINAANATNIAKVNEMIDLINQKTGSNVNTLASDATSLQVDMISKKGYDAAKGGGLRLQIGDTGDSFNQLTVSIGDMHSEAIGIGDVDISTQDGAAAALDKIKAAINNVSDTRGNMGALQNRLDHTINNLGVMKENIQNAESTIRDTDVAEEMMTYTKNSILNQSAQAMLAQANQLPQGVLQLLQ